FFPLLLRPPPRDTLFPYTTLFRSQKEIEHFLEKRKSYHYALLGAFCCSIHIPVKFKNGYFCSQFVAEILERAGVAALKKKKSERSEEHTSELQSRFDLVCRLLLEK